jgi:hypothetical protein
VTITRAVLITSYVRAVAVTTGAVLIAFTVGYYLTYEPAPEIRILWRAGLDPERRAELEQRFLLVNATPFEDRLTYDLLDTRLENVEALVNERDIQDTDRVDRVGFTIPQDIPYGTSWMWVAHRLPVLRYPGLVQGIVLACAIVLAASLGVLLIERRKASRSPDEVTP